MWFLVNEKDVNQAVHRLRERKPFKRFQISQTQVTTIIRMATIRAVFAPSWFFTKNLRKYTSTPLFL